MEGESSTAQELLGLEQGRGDGRPRLFSRFLARRRSYTSAFAEPSKRKWDRPVVRMLLIAGLVVILCLGITLGVYFAAKVQGDDQGKRKSRGAGEAGVRQSLSACNSAMPYTPLPTPDGPCFDQVQLIRHFYCKQTMLCGNCSAISGRTCGVSS